jgi:hypothetical protein
MMKSASDLQERILAALRNSPNLAHEPDDFLQQLLAGLRYSAEHLRLAVDAIYQRVYYSRSNALHIDEKGERGLFELVRLLNLDEDRTAALNYSVGLALYKKRFRDCVADGDVTEKEESDLQAIAHFYCLRKRDINRAISGQALAYYSFLLSDAVKDHVLDEDEMAKLALVAHRYNLTTKQLSTISIPQKKEVLRTALASIKARGRMSDVDREHIRSIAAFLNATSLLKHCLKDLDLYEEIFRIRQGDLPQIEIGQLILDAGEKLHYSAPAVYERQEASRLRRQKGTLYVGSFWIRFVGLKRAHQIRYRNILQINLKIGRTPKLSLAVSSGRGGGSYRLTKNNDPGRLALLQEMIRFLVRKSRGLEKRTGRNSAHIRDDVRSEVWFRDGGQCVICGAKEYLEFDHIIPRSKGGAASVDNLQILCRKCNSEKGGNI